MKSIMPTEYNPEIHGVMTKEERYAYNQKLMDSIPEESEQDFLDYMKYKSYASCGKFDMAEPYKAGYVRELQWMEKDKEARSKRLYTREEIEEIGRRKKMAHDITKKALKEVGLSVTVEDFESIMEP